MPYRRLLCCLLLIVAIATSLSGCLNKQAQDTKTPQLIGVVDLDRAMRAHPRWSQLQELNKKINTLFAQQQQTQDAQALAGKESASDAASLLPADEQNGIDAFLKEEYTAKMAARQTELNVALQEKIAALHRQTANEYQSYAEELEKEYQPELFSLQLKIKTLQMDKEQMSAVQQEIDKIQAEKEAKLTAKNQELSAQFQAAVAPYRAEMEGQLSGYAQNLEAEQAAKRAEKTVQQQQFAAALTAPDEQAAPGLDEPPADTTDIDREIAVLKQQIAVLQDIMIADIRDKTAKIAAEKGIDTVLANVDVNISAQDITNEVIAEFKK